MSEPLEPAAVPQATTRICVDCEHRFRLSADDKRWYFAQGWVLPRRCRPCRDLRRELKADAEALRAQAT